MEFVKIKVRLTNSQGHTMPGTAPTDVAFLLPMSSVAALKSTGGNSYSVILTPVASQALRDKGIHFVDAPTVIKNVQILE